MGIRGEQPGLFGAPVAARLAALFNMREHLRLQQDAAAGRQRRPGAPEDVDGLYRAKHIQLAVDQQDKVESAAEVGLADVAALVRAGKLRGPGGVDGVRDSRRGEVDTNALVAPLRQALRRCR